MSPHWGTGRKMFPPWPKTDGDGNDKTANAKRASKREFRTQKRELKTLDSSKHFRIQ